MLKSLRNHEASSARFHCLPPQAITTNQKKQRVAGVGQCREKLECGTWYHHPRRLQCVLSRNLRIFKVATWHYRCRHNLKNNCIWDNLQYCLLVPRSSSKPVMLTIDFQSQKCYSLRSFLACITWKDNNDIGIYWRDIALAICSRSQPLLNMNIERNFEATLWRHRWRHHH